MYKFSNFPTKYVGDIVVLMEETWNQIKVHDSICDILNAFDDNDCGNPLVFMSC